MYLTGLILIFTDKIVYWIILNYVTPGHTHKVISQIFLVINRPTYGIGLACFVIPMVLNRASVLRKIFAAKIFLPISRLTYSAYLIHGLVIMWNLFQRKQIMNLSNHVYLNIVISTAFLSFFIAIPFSLLYEQPFILMERLLSYNKDRYEDFRQSVDSTSK